MKQSAFADSIKQINRIEKRMTRLKEVNAELLAALENIIKKCDDALDGICVDPIVRIEIIKGDAQAAIANAEKEG